MVEELQALKAYAGAPTAAKMSRIDTAVQAVAAMASRVEVAALRVTQHAHSLGYYAPPQVGNGPAIQAPTPVITTMADAIDELDKATDRLSAALNLFD